MSDHALAQFLFGLRVVGSHHEAGVSIPNYTVVTEHRAFDKVIPSNFFSSPEAENISAVLFSNSGTIAKFNRMGHQDPKLRHSSIRMWREGLRYDFDPGATRPLPFSYEVGDGQHWEGWAEGLSLFLNPNARIPFQPEVLGVSTTKLESGQFASEIVGFHPFKSKTVTVKLED